VGVLRTLEKPPPSHRRHNGYLDQPTGKMSYEIAKLIIAREVGKLVSKCRFFPAFSIKQGTIYFFVDLSWK